MKKGQIILSVIAFGITAVSSLAFKAHNKFSGGNIYTKTSGTCTLHVTCAKTATAGGSCVVAGPYYTTATRCANNQSYANVKTVD